MQINHFLWTIKLYSGSLISKYPLYFDFISFWYYQLHLLNTRLCYRCFDSHWENVTVEMPHLHWYSGVFTFEKGACKMDVHSLAKLCKCSWFWNASLLTKCIRSISLWSCWYKSQHQFHHYLLCCSLAEVASIFCQLWSQQDANSFFSHSLNVYITSISAQVLWKTLQN